MKKMITALAAALALPLAACATETETTTVTETVTKNPAAGDPVAKLAEPTHDWLMERGAQAAGLDGKTFRKAVILSCGYAQQESDKDLPTIRAAAEQSIRVQLKEVPEEKVTMAFLTATATGCPHLIQGQGVNALKLVLEGQ